VGRRAFVEGIDMQALRFDPEAMLAHWEATRHDRAPYRWTVLEREVMAPFWPAAAAEQAAG
jgi:hypothetical protein